MAQRGDVGGHLTIHLVAWLCTYISDYVAIRTRRATGWNTLRRGGPRCRQRGGTAAEDERLPVELAIFCAVQIVAGVVHRLVVHLEVRVRGICGRWPRNEVVANHVMGKMATGVASGVASLVVILHIVDELRVVLSQ